MAEENCGVNGPAPAPFLDGTPLPIRLNCAPGIERRSGGQFPGKRGGPVCNGILTIHWHGPSMNFVAKACSVGEINALQMQGALTYVAIAVRRNALISRAVRACSRWLANRSGWGPLWHHFSKTWDAGLGVH